MSGKTYHGLDEGSARAHVLLVLISSFMKAIADSNAVPEGLASQLTNSAITYILLIKPHKDACSDGMLVR